MFTGLKDVDRLILRKIDSEKDLARVFQVDKYTNGFYSDDKFWIARFFDRYGKYLEDENVLKYKKDKKWREYYYEITRAVLSYFPYFMSAMYMDVDKEKRRNDILKVLERALKLKHVEKVYVNFGDSREEFFTRDGEYEGVREGMGILEQFVNNKINVSVSIYRNGFTLEENYYENDKIKRYRKFNPFADNTVSKNIEFSVKGQILIKEKISEGGFKKVKRFFANGNPRSTGFMLPNNKKHGKWLIYSKDGSLTEKNYHKGKLMKIL